MADTYGKKKRKHNNILYAAITALLIFAVFITILNYFYSEAQNDAYEMLHIQTKQIKDDLTLQIKSDRENLVTMAHFAADLYADGESYDRMFEAFEPIGLLSNIGILNPDNTFVTKVGKIDLSGKIDFDAEAALGEHITGRVKDLTRENEEIIRSSVPIKVDGEIVGILYGVIHPETISGKYNNMAKELDAQLFVYDKETGIYVINSIENSESNISSLKNRKFNDAYSFDDIMNKHDGYVSFKSIKNGQDLYLHFSTIDDFNWGIMLARYDSQVFSETHEIANYMLAVFLFMISIVSIYFLFVLENEKKEKRITQKASEIRKLLLEINQKSENITKALKTICETSQSCSAVFVDTNGEDCSFADKNYENNILTGEDRQFFVSELFRYALEFESTKSVSMCVMNIEPDAHLKETNNTFYKFLNKHGIKLVTFAAVSRDRSKNSIGVLGVINPKRKYLAANLIEEIAVCFSIALYNKLHLNKTYAAATTDSLTGVLNRVAYKKDLKLLDSEGTASLACIYVDVNELHLRNNKYGHAAGDEMLIYIANALNSIFYGHKVYRMGGDEFLVFAQNIEFETVNRCIEILNEQLGTQSYHVAIGISYRAHNANAEEMVREAERRMYSAKAEYYQMKEKTTTSSSEDKSYVMVKTGIREIDTMLSVLKEHYNGIYRVSLNTDRAYRILMPAYFAYDETEEHFTKLMTKYVDETVHPDFHRAVLSFLNYDALKKQISEGNIPKITYKKSNGELVILSVYALDESNNEVDETLWVFSKA